MATPKIIPYTVKLRSVVPDKTFSKPPVVYTNDLRSAEFQFKITDMDASELLTATAKTMLYMRDGSFFQNPSTDVSRVGNVFSYLLKENEGNHAGSAKIQLVVYFNEGLANEQNFPTQLYEFEITNGLETKVAQEVMIHDWTTLTAEAQVYLDQMAEKHAIADADHTRAETDHTTAVADHTTAASDHTTALADHAVTADMIANGTNLVTNGDFSNGTTGWFCTPQLQLTVLNGAVRVYFDNTNGEHAYPNISQVIEVTAQHQYYVAFNIVEYAHAPSSSFFQIGSSIVKYFSNVGKYSIVHTPSENSNMVYFNNYVSVGQIVDYKVQNVSIIDLTATFGAGNEPTAAQMDRLLTLFPNSWFDGTENLFLAKWALNELRRLDNEKANKDQEAWITPTLLNGWDNFGSGLSAAAYMRDEFGFVHLKGVVVGGSTLPDTLIFTLPAGYVPTEKRMFCVNSNDTMGRVHIDPYVGVIVQKATSGFLQLDGITFKAEA